MTDADVRIPAYALVIGPEALLADRAVDSMLAVLRADTADLEVIRLYAETYQAGELEVLVSPSLFGGAKVVVVHDLQAGDEALQRDLLAYLDAPADDVTLILRHQGGNKAKKVLDALRAHRARVIEAQAVKSDRDKQAFVANEFRARGRKASAQAVRALVDALGRDLRELAGGCAQLVEDTEGVVDERIVEVYYGGRVEATGFRVAEAAVAGRLGEALSLLRHALAAGLDPVPIVAVLALQLRQVARVGAAGRARSADLAARLGMAPWQVDRARATAAGWSPEGLGRAIQAVAAADVDVKGGARDPVYAVERAIMTIAAERAAGRTERDRAAAR